MATRKINDLDLALAVSDTMQFETDIGGSLSNKINWDLIKQKLNANTELSNVAYVDKLINEFSGELSSNTAKIGIASDIAGATLSVGGTIGASGLNTDKGIVQTSATGVLSTSTDIPDGTTATTQNYWDNSEKIATTYYADRILYLIDSIGSAGWLTEGNLTDNLDGSVTISAGSGFFRENDSSSSNLVEGSWNQTIIPLTDSSNNYIYVEYNSGSVTVKVSTSGTTILENERNIFELYEVFRNGTTLHVTPHKQIALDVFRLVQQRLYSLNSVERANGLMIGNTGTRNVTLTAGEIWIKLNKIPIDAINTSISDTFDRYYQNGSGGFNTETSQTQWDNVHYDNGSGTLGTIPAQKWSNQYYWIESDNRFISVFGTNYYNLESEALQEDKPSFLPPVISDHSIFVGRVTFQVSSSVGTMTSPFKSIITLATTTDHNELANVYAQGTGVTYGHVDSSGYTRSLARMGFTGILSGGEISVNGSDPSKIDISAGSYRKIDNSDPLNPVVTDIIWPNKSGVTLTYLATAAGTFLAIDESQNVVQTVSPLTPSQLRAYGYIGRVSHFDKATVTGLYNYKSVFSQNNIDRASYLNLIGTVNIIGNIFSANGANLKLDKDEGYSERLGANYVTDPNNPNTPYTQTITQIPFRRIYQGTGCNTILSALTTDLDPNNYQSAINTLSAVPSNKWTIQTVLFFPNNTTHTTMVIYGQKLYNSFEEANAELGFYRPDICADMDGGTFRANIAIKEGITNLSAAIAAGTAEIREITDSGGGGGGTAANYWSKETDGISYSSSDLQNTFLQMINTNASINAKSSAGLNSSRGYSIRLTQDPLGTPTTITPFVIDATADDYGIHITANNAVLFNTVSTDGNQMMEITTKSTARKWKWTDATAGKNIYGSIQVGASPWGSDIYAFDIGQTGGVGTFGIFGGSNKLFSLGADGSIVSTANAYHGFNGYYNSGWKVYNSSNSAVVLKHFNDSNKWAWLVSTTTTAGDALTEAKSSLMTRIDASHSFYFTDYVNGLSCVSFSTGSIATDGVFTTGIPSFVGQIRAFESIASYSKAQIECKFTTLSTSIGGSFVEAPFTITKDTTSSVNIYFDTGELCIQNKTASSVNVYLSINVIVYQAAP